MDIFRTAKDDNGLSIEEIKAALIEALEGRRLNKVLLVPPDFTRFHSNAGLISNFCYTYLTAKGVEVDVLPALGTHVPVSESQWKTMFGEIPYDRMIVHNWRKAGRYSRRCSI